ncbi:AmmeMemoRadiSam system protein A [Clostridiaceae bacterium HSG29]|nr:AmmeMemoRadiSam system protein A [Clostridiaceae bacterium HSG29]
MSLIAGYIMPHPPIIIDKIGKEDVLVVKKTKDAMEKIANEIKNMSPDTIIVITPHGTVFSDAFTINYKDLLYGNLSTFGYPEVELRKNNEISLVEEIVASSLIENIPIAKLDNDLVKRFNITDEIDHGIIVPLYYIEKEYSKYNLIHINYSGLSYNEHYKFGMAIRNACENIDKKIIIIASGDLSHKLSNKGPYTYSPSGVLFDQKIIDCLKEKDIRSIINMDADFVNEAGECGKRSIDTLIGTLDGYDYETEVLSYEGPFGVGYGVVSFKNFIKDDSKNIYDILLNDEIIKHKKIVENEDEYVKLARTTIEEYIKNGNKINVDKMNLPVEMLENRAGVFVSIKKHSLLRGCIGTTGMGMEKNIAKEIVRNAIEASTKDPRFNEVEEYELNELVISVDILEKSEKVNDLKELDVKKYGIIVESGYKRGLLLPNLEGVDTVEKQLEIVLRKAGIVENEDYTVEKFRVTRHK